MYFRALLNISVYMLWILQTELVLPKSQYLKVHKHYNGNHASGSQCEPGLYKAGRIRNCVTAAVAV